MMTYKVGQVLYVVPTGKNVVVPIQIIEEITKKTMEGQVLTYSAVIGTEPDKPVQIEQIKGELFESAELVQRALIDRATHSIQKIVAKASGQAREWFPTGIEQVAAAQSQMIVPAVEATASAPRPPLPEDTVEVMMPDGSIARVKVPQNVL